MVNPGAHFIERGPDFLSYISLQPNVAEPYIIQTINFARSDNLSLKNQRFTSLDCVDIWIRKLEFVTKTQFLLNIIF